MKNSIQSTSSIAENAAQDDQPLVIFAVKENQKCSRSLYFLLSDYKKAFDLFFFTIQLATKADHVRKTASDVLSRTAQNKEEQEKYRLIAESEDLLFEQMKQYSYLNSSNIVNSVMNSFLCYLSHIIGSSMRKNIQMIKSSEVIKVSDLIDFRTKRDLVEFIIEKKINELSYSGIRGVEEYIKERMSLDIFATTERRDLLILFNEIRNIQVHNRGYINSIFLSRVKNKCGYVLDVGKRVHADFEMLARLSHNCMTVACDFDHAIAKKFKLPTKEFSAWRKLNPPYVQ